MKKILILVIGIILFYSCEKFGREKEERRCPLLTAEAVPAKVSDSFRTKYPNTNVEKWYNKDNEGFFAVFNSAGTKKVSLFNNEGGFVNENKLDDDEGYNENENGCEIDDEDED